ncbi:MAG: TauD/TfdA family dioxygenase [Gammaproteobacteria bacterium]|nr:TauD/TfdA family dioxygenase [Gammaproteobacteria bacterium]
MNFRPITALTGAEVQGIDVRTVGPASFQQLRKALAHYKVLYIQNQHLDTEQLCTFSRGIGPLIRVPFIQPMEENADVIAVLKEADETNMGVFGGDWHSDFSFLPQPPMASILYSVEVPEAGGDTVWANMAAAYAALPEATKAFLKDRQVIHTGKPYGTTHAPPRKTRFTGSIQMDRNNPDADKETVHPAVCRHPDTGEPMLFVSPTYTTRFSDLSEAQSEPVLNEIYAHSTQPEFTCRHRWQAGTIAMWDNRATMHCAMNDYDGYRRLLFRTTIAGHKPLAH